ncbi:MAG: hypothetical protein Ta2B_21290 [Termitinemataceae bacterium]|nr:MAG: hypothetical protein Ta2B_21290 [Termitinemataceae bacterium]
MSMPIIPLFLADDIGVHDPVSLKLWVGIIQSCGSVTLAFFAPIWGHLADVYSRRAMLLRAMACGAVIVSLMALVRHPYQLLILRSLQGCFTGTIAAATVLTASFVPSETLPLALGMLQTGIAAGSSLGPLFGGLITDFFGHRFAFFGTGICLAIAALIVFFGVEELQVTSKNSCAARLHGLSPHLFGSNARHSTFNLRLPTMCGHLLAFLSFKLRKNQTQSCTPLVFSDALQKTAHKTQSTESAESAGSTEEKKLHKNIFPDFRIILSSPIVLSLIIVSFAIQVANTTANPILPLFLRDLCIGTKYQSYLGSATGIVLGAGALSTAVAALLSGKFSMRIGGWKTLIFCLTAGALCIVPQALAQNIVQLTVIHIVASFFIGGAVPVLQAMLASNCERGHQGSVFGVNSAISSTGAALGPLIGSAAAMISYRAVFPITALILGGCAANLIKRRKGN